jgi:hypothetical protein
MFQNDTWNRHLPNLAVFDDAFVDENVCSGLSVEADHRQNLHELIIGAQGVALNQQLQAYVSRIEAHNAELRTRASAVPAASMGGMTIDAFCALQPEPNIDANIQEAERALQAAREQTPIREARPFEAITLSRCWRGTFRAWMRRRWHACRSIYLECRQAAKHGLPTECGEFRRAAVSARFVHKT